ncbi:MAG: hypothetical protein LBM69_03025 [Lachnospiraceae bacterium]|jgi:hypothetical protein|nr:hypothetical protein [Lachnospiraceae bacterium]
MELKKPSYYPEGFRFTRNEQKMVEMVNFKGNKICESLILTPAFVQSPVWTPEREISVTNGCVILKLGYLLWKEKQECCYVPVNTEMIRKWRFTQIQVLRKALRNCAQNLPAKLLGRVSDNQLILTTSKEVYGTMALFYPDMIPHISTLFGGDFYADFSNLHAVSLYPARSCESLKKCMNMAHTMSPFETNSYRKVYRYSAGKDTFMEL